MVRIGLASFSWQVARPISYPLGALLYDSGGYVRVFAASLILYILACLLGLYALWGFREQRVGGDTSFTPCLASPQPQVFYPRAGPPTPSLIHMVELEFVGLLNNPRQIFAQLQKL